MSQAVWSGTIGFGLVAIPVKLYPATEPKDVRFHLYDRRSGRRIHYARVTRADEPPVFAPEPAADASAREEAEPSPPPRLATSIFREASIPPEPVTREDVVRGYALPEGDVVTVSDAELGAVAPERSRAIEIEEFVKLADIDPVFYEKSYLVAPVRGAGAEKPYALLLRAMQTAGMVGIGRFVLRTRPHLVAIRPRDHVLGLETLFFADEVRSADEVGFDPAAFALNERELKTARQLIAAMATEWTPERHGDAYREELLALLRSKTPAPAPEATAAPEVAGIHDLMAELRASVEAAKRKQTPKKSATKRAG